MSRFPAVVDDAGFQLGPSVAAFGINLCFLPSAHGLCRSQDRNLSSRNRSSQRMRPDPVTASFDGLEGLACCACAGSRMAA